MPTTFVFLPNSSPPWRSTAYEDLLNPPDATPGRAAGLKDLFDPRHFRELPTTPDDEDKATTTVTPVRELLGPVPVTPKSKSTSRKRLQSFLPTWIRDLKKKKYRKTQARVKNFGKLMKLRDPDVVGLGSCEDTRWRREMRVERGEDDKERVDDESVLETPKRSVPPPPNNAMFRKEMRAALPNWIKDHQVETHRITYTRVKNFGKVMKEKKPAVVGLGRCRDTKWRKIRMEKERGESRENENEKLMELVRMMRR